jgi:RNA 2',3'-cyclic 3'-phosphodiesterase
MRLFIVVDMPEEIKDQLAKTAQELEGKGRTLVKKEMYHITLQFLGEIREEKLPDVITALSQLGEENLKPFKVSIEGLSFFGREPRVIFANVLDGAERLKSLYAEIDEKLRSNNINYKNENDYRPHVTLARIRSSRNNEAMLSLLTKEKNRLFGHFTVNSIILKKSVLEKGEYVHENYHEIKFQ